MKNRNLLLASTFLTAGLMLGGTAGQAQTALEEIVVKTNFNTRNFVNPDVTVMDGQQLLTTPTPITVIDPERFNLDTVNYTNTRYELMNRVPGMTDVRNLRVPCGWCDYTVNLQNGMATRPLGRGNFNFDSANNFDIERIEIIKGPASALYPSHAFGGVINVITKKPPKQPTLRTFADFGSWGRYRFGADFGFTIGDAHIQDWQLGSLGFKVNASHYELNGWRSWRGEKKDTGSFRVVWQPTDSTTAEFGGTRTKYYDESPGSLTEAQFNADWGDVGTGRYGPYADIRKTTNLDGRVTHKFSDSGEILLPWGFVHEKTENRWGINHTDRHDIKPRYTQRFDFMKAKLITGADFTLGRLKDIDDDNIIDTRIASPYGQFEFSPLAGTGMPGDLKFTIGGRYEYVKYDYEKSGGQEEKKSFDGFTPHAGVTWQWNEKNSIWFSYSRGFNPPSERRLWPDSGRYTYLPNPDLKPEKAENFEIGARGSLLEDRVIYDVSWHNTTIKDFIVDQYLYNVGSREVHQYFNAGKVRLKGVEAQLGLWPVKWAGVEASYTYAINKYVDYRFRTRTSLTDYSGNYMYASPRHHLNARFILKPVKGAKVELEWDHTSKYYIDNANTDTYKRPDLFHLSGSYRWNDIITVWGQVRNLTDKKYADRVSLRRGTKYYRPGLPRSYAVGVTLMAKF